MSLWGDKWLVLVHIIDGVAEGSKYYFPTKEEAEVFRLKIVKEKDIEAVYLIPNPDYEEL